MWCMARGVFIIDHAESWPLVSVHQSMLCIITSIDLWERSDTFKIGKLICLCNPTPLDLWMGPTRRASEWEACGYKVVSGELFSMRSDLSDFESLGIVSFACCCNLCHHSLFSAKSQQCNHAEITLIYGFWDGRSMRIPFGIVSWLKICIMLEINWQRTIELLKMNAQPQVVMQYTSGVHCFSIV